MANFFESHIWRATIHKAYSIGASIVVLGALFKLEHMPMASTFLTVGLCTEALIFFISAFEPFPRDVDWTIVFPELAGENSDDYTISPAKPVRTVSPQVNSEAASTAMQHYTENMENIAESTGLLNKLSVNCAMELEAMNKNLNALNAVYELQLKETNQHLHESLSAINNMAKISEDAHISSRLSIQYQTNLTELNQNLASLNKVYGNMLAAMNIQK